MIEYIAWAERQQDRTVKHVLTDKGGEFFNNEIDKWYKAHGIVHEPCGPDAPESNPSERMNQTLADMMRAMMKHSGLPSILWTEAALHAAYLRNRVQSKHNGGVAPFERWYNIKPSVRHIRPFGTLGYVFIAKHHRSKLDDKSVALYLVEYSDASTGYKRYFPKTNRIRFVPDVRFC
ncbi:TPA: hypothetical protein N0F65_009423 [Lagenidium giganteum]|uniref:Integrase catalytic domain-containing protein n=1 Tax=Lagenidium giganteum TaxID=4803 RepID=A0AAV2Z9H1_9STRA|nr:TPA: hypothetical protein N0F65_009423 [Lagenidium giganteum]